MKNLNLNECFAVAGGVDEDASSEVQVEVDTAEDHAKEVIEASIESVDFE